MNDLFSYEQEVLDNALKYAEDMSDMMYLKLANEYSVLLKQLRRMTKVSDSTTKTLNATLLIAEELNNSIAEKNALLDYEIKKFELVNRALISGLWDMEIHSDEEINPDTPVIWSDQLRSLLGYTDETDFPNVFQSMLALIHPEDKDQVISSFNLHLEDTTGQSIYDVEFRMQNKTQEYRWYRNIGATIRDENDTPFKVAGLLVDIDEHKSYEMIKGKTQ